MNSSVAIAMFSPYTTDCRSPEFPLNRRARLGRRLLLRRLSALFLLTDLVQNQHERLRHRGQDSHEAGDRRLHQEEQLRDQLLAAGQCGDVLDLIRTDGPALDNAALELDRR